MAKIRPVKESLLSSWSVSRYAHERLLHTSLKPLPNPPLFMRGSKTFSPVSGGMIAKRDVAWGVNSTFARDAHELAFTNLAMKMDFQDRSIENEASQHRWDMDAAHS
jgi:hypothetical protein